MAFRTSLNRHDSWLKMWRENAELLRALPSFATAREEDFRRLMIDGELPDREGRDTVCLSSLTDQEFDDLWTFVQHKAQFDMDVILFDSFNREFAIRRSRRRA